jgi:tRNA pseudouridine38-40 synthase
MAENDSEAVWKFRLTIAYDGSRYAGWQVQKVGVGVQQRIEEAFQRIFPSVQRIHGSSRTDTGVHALGMVAHVEIPKHEFRMGVRKLALAINAHLPPDIRIMKATRCRNDFHARFDAKGKQYRYQVWNARSMNPLLNLRARHFLGRQDFKTLAANRDYEMESTVRTLTRVDLRRSGELLTFVIEGDGFLYKMCRAIVGTLVQVGTGRLSPEDVPSMLAEKDRRAGGVNAPAHGLVLWKVFYDRSGRVA